MRSRVVEIFSSGSALPDAAVAELTQKFGRSAVEVYGSSETGGIAIRRQQPGYTAPWQPFNVVGCRLADDGRLEISSPYLPSADWYRTDDLVKFDGQGRFHLLGRSDQLVKVEGKRVSLQKVQSALVGLEDVQDAKVVLLTSASRDLLGAVVVLARSGLDYLFAHGKGSLINRLRRELTTGLDALSIPRKWRFVEQIPMNAQGKFVAEYVQSLFHDASSVKRPEVLGAYVEDAERCFVLGVPDNLLYFHGHFDAAAILPGVVQVDWAMWLATSAFDIEGEFQSMEAVKFHRLVRPGDVVRLELARAGNKLRFKYSTHEALVSSGRIVFTESLP